MISIKYAVLAAYFEWLNPKNAGEYVELFHAPNWEEKLVDPVYLTGIVENYAFFLELLFELREYINKNKKNEIINTIKIIEMFFNSIDHNTELEEKLEQLKKGEYSVIEQLFKGEYYFPLNLNELGVDPGAFCMTSSDPDELKDNFKWYAAALSFEDIGFGLMFLADTVGGKLFKIYGKFIIFLYYPVNLVSKIYYEKI